MSVKERRPRCESIRGVGGVKTLSGFGYRSVCISSLFISLPIRSSVGIFRSILIATLLDLASVDLRFILCQLGKAVSGVLAYLPRPWEMRGPRMAN